MLSQNIKNTRKQKGYTQETFAEELNVVRQTVSKWEKGYSVPDALMLEKIADLCEVPVSDLLGSAEEKPEEKSDLKMISEQLSILNDQLARELRRKRRNRRIALIVLGVLLVGLLVLFAILIRSDERPVYEIDGQTGMPVARELDAELDAAVSAAILSANPVQPWWPEECAAESHYVLGTDEADGKVVVYLIEEFTHFGFRNGFFTDLGGGRTPVVLTFQKTDDGYRLLSRETARDGSEYVESIRALFPFAYANKVIRGLSENEDAEMWANEARQAKEYLASIGRIATVCRYRDIRIELLTDLGIPVEVGNKLCELRIEYDVDVGSHEKLENGVRYVYQTDYHAAAGRITFTKFVYATGEIVEFLAYNAFTGDPIENAPAPDSVAYYEGHLETDVSESFVTAAYPA
ncbi:MAG: helix-turn-helix transcriptional regulator [Clostridia bacterium]|nr:helix-turn-helix transcriptional regulator [Clostridia bacterium]